ncbi:MAG: sugar transferase [Alphaproteobacteria bacterium]|jgi:O-antigen biosynthesis protein WbqP|nr:sugar transferase [Alphaproteobacteria bacterium]
MKRTFDFLTSFCALLLLLPLIIVVSVAIKLTSRGPILYWSDRVGKNNILFKMPKFRTMKVGTPPLPTHLMTNSNYYLTPIGSFLRRTSLDEIPQLWSILKGDMSFVGPRPALFNQDDLVALRTELGVHHLVPGLTGWAQINGRDSLPIPEKVLLDKQYMERKSFFFDCYIFLKTIQRIIYRKDISH